MSTVWYLLPGEGLESFTFHWKVICALTPNQKAEKKTLILPQTLLRVTRTHTPKPFGSALSQNLRPSLSSGFGLDRAH